MLGNTPLPNNPHGIDYTMYPNVFLVNKYNNNFVNLCTVTPNAQSITCDLTGFDVGAPSAVFIVSTSTNYVLSMKENYPASKIGYFISQSGISQLISLNYGHIMSTLSGCK